MKTKPYFQMDFCWQDVKLLLQIYYNVIDFFIALDLTLIKKYIYNYTQSAWHALYRLALPKATDIKMLF